MLTFDEWFDKRFPLLSWNQSEYLRDLYKNYAREAWNASRENLTNMDI